MLRFLLVVTLVALATAGPAKADAPKPRRNVVLMIADDLGIEVGCYGDKVAKTPHIDALAKKGGSGNGRWHQPVGIRHKKQNTGERHGKIYRQSIFDFGVAHAAWVRRRRVGSLPKAAKS